jgi:hypothetical protein
MRNRRKRSFSDLVNENKLEILKNRDALEKIERKWEEKHIKKAE